MPPIHVVGLDLAEEVLQVHAITADETVAIRQSGFAPSAGSRMAAGSRVHDARGRGVGLREPSRARRHEAASRLKLRPA